MDEYNNDNIYKEIKNVIFEEQKNSICLLQNFSFSQIKQLEKLKMISFDNKNHFKALKKIFSPFNFQEIDLGNYFIYDNHAINKGSYRAIFLEHDKKTNIKVGLNKWIYY